MGFPDVRVVLALRPEQRAGSDAIWDKAEDGLRQALNAAGLDFTEEEGEGAFYGPKVEYHLTDAIGRSWQCGTLQLDFVLPERLDASYIGEDGEKHRPVMLHRAVLGTLERFIGIMIENYAGKLPMWLAPTHCVVASITDEANEYAAEVYKALKQAGVRAVLDTRNEKINYKIREHSVAKIPAIFVVGAREAEARTVAIRRLGGKDQVLCDLDKAVSDLADEATAPY
jgi:threonyl-tRNA synthetase